MANPTPGHWRFIPITTWPFGFRVMAGDICILTQEGACYSTDQQTRQDNELGVGFTAVRRSPTQMTIEEAQALIAEQDANGRLMAASKSLLAALKFALCALETPGDLTADEKRYVIEDATNAIREATEPKETT